ncbi:DNA-protecting protein DprA [Patescibacteria group bacterium]|nr:DNA-protecting protein DprA [Patescibacteria group bacterium]
MGFYTCPRRMKNVITIEDGRYPKLLKEIKDAPKQLYCKGNWDDSIFENCLAVVGSRRMTSYGKRATERLVRDIAAAGVTIVSGFMYGVDATAHQAALSVGGRTIAVMPCGIDLIHPGHQEDLYNEIIDNNGLIVSEYEGGMKPSNWTYPRRNRIVAGLSWAALIVEAGKKSGSLITANFARKFKRKLFSVPGPITSATSMGTLELIKEGAVLAVNSRDVLDYYGFAQGTLLHSQRQTHGLPEAHSGAFPLQKKIFEELQREPLEIDELSRLLEASVSEVGTTLSIMQLQGLITQEGRKYYVN